MENKLDVGSKVLKDLVRMLEDEINRQYIRKEQIENRVGFLFAFWGIMLAPVVDLIFKTDKNVIGTPTIIMFTFLGVSCVVSFVGLICCVKKTEVARYNYEDKYTSIIGGACKDTYRTYLDEKYVHLHEVLQQNEEKISLKAKYLTFSIGGLSLYTAIFIGCLIQQFILTRGQ